MPTALLESADTCQHNPELHSVLSRILHSNAHCIPNIYMHQLTHAHCFCLACGASCTAMHNVHLWLLQSSALTCPLPHSDLYMYLKSHAYCFILFSECTCTHVCTKHFCSLHGPALTCPLHTSFFMYMESHAHCTPLFSTWTCTHMPTVHPHLSMYV